MTAEDLLAKLEKGELVAPEIIASLRRQVAAAKEPITPAAVAKLLVDKGHLTAGQAQRLVEQPSSSQIAKQPVAASTSKIGKPASSSAIQKSAPVAPTKPAAPAHNSSVLDDLGLAPLEDLDALSAPSPPAAKSAVKAAPAQVAAPKIDDLGLAPLDDLSPLDSPAPTAKSTIQKTAPQKPAGPQPAQPAAKNTPQKSAIQKAPAKPAAAPAPAGLADLPPLDDLGGLTALDELSPLDGLSPLGNDPLGDPLGGGLADLSSPLGGTADLGALATQTSAPARAQISPATVAAAQAASESRTTLFVGLGIGGAALLVIVIGLAVFFWPRGDGLLEFQAAEQAFQEKQYPTAIEKYDLLLRLHPRHEQASLARVHRGLCTIQIANSSPPNWQQLLPVLSSTTEELAAEPAFGQIHGELAPLLVKLTEALADAATGQKVDQQTASRLQQARAALTLCNDSRLLPSTLRPWQKLADIEDRLQLLAREVNRAAAREQAKSSVAAALAAGNLTAALQLRTSALVQYPELAGDELWTELAADFSAAASKSVKVVADKKAAERDPAASPIQAAMPWQLLNARLQANPPPASEVVQLVAAAGAVHALDGSTGHARWSRYLGHSDWPITSPDGKLAWFVDRERNELLSVTAANGNLLWRQPLPQPAVGSPILVRDKVYLSLSNGRLLTFDSASGELQSTWELPQALFVGAVATNAGQQLLQLADEGLLYVINVADGKCSAVHLGFERGTVLFPPVIHDRQLIVAAARGEQTELHVVAIEAAAPTVKRQRVDGVIAAPLVATPTVLFVSTAQGKIHVLQPSSDSDPFKLVQTIAPVGNSRLLRHLQGTRTGVLAADRGLSLLKFDAAGKVQPSWTAFSVDLFEGSGSELDERLLTARYVADQQAMFAAKVNTNDGIAAWQSPLNPPLILLSDQQEGSRPIAVPAAAVAKLLTLDASADLGAEFKNLLSQPGNVNLKAPPLGDLIPFGDEQLIVPAPGSRELLFVKPADYSVRKLPLPGQLAGRPAVAGKNLLVPLGDGSIQCLNSATGETTAAPFLLPTSSVASFTVIALDEAGQTALVSDGGQALARISLVAEPKPHWVELTAIRLPQPLAAAPVALAEAVFAADRAGQLLVYALPDLTAAASVDLKGGQLTWGPHRAGDSVLLATDRDELWCCDAARQPRWLQPLPAGQLVGLPLVRDGKLILTTSSGQIEVRSAGSGDLTASAQLRQPLAGSALLSGNSLWLTTNFGLVLQATLPSEVVP